MGYLFVTDVFVTDVFVTDVFAKAPKRQNLSRVEMGLDPEIPGAIAPPTPKTIKVASYSVYDLRREEVGGVCKLLIEQSAADVITLQGCSGLSLEVIFREFKSRGYQYSRFDQDPSKSTHEVIFSKLPILKKMYKRFSQTTQHRALGGYLVKVGIDQPTNVWIVTSHLEIGAHGNGTRRLQALEFPKMVPVDAETPVIFAGDTSIPSWQQNATPPVGWTDGWREKGTGDNEKTSLHDRMDRIWFVSTSPGGNASRASALECTSFELVCRGEERRGVMATFLVG